MSYESVSLSVIVVGFRMCGHSFRTRIANRESEFLATRVAPVDRRGRRLREPTVLDIFKSLFSRVAVTDVQSMFQPAQVANEQAFS